jgi:uncharacterized phage-associated protein
MPTHRSKLDIRKVIEATAVLAKRSLDHEIGSKTLLALLYIANRECLKKSGRPLIGGTLRALKYGPVHSEVYDLIKDREDAPGLPAWSQYFHTDGVMVVLDKDPGINALSRFEVKLLNDAAEKYAGWEPFDLSRETHKFSEYVTTYRKGRPGTITLGEADSCARPDPNAHLNPARS